MLSSLWIRSRRSGGEKKEEEKEEKKGEAGVELFTVGALRVTISAPGPDGKEKGEREKRKGKKKKSAVQP